MHGTGTYYSATGTRVHNRGQVMLYLLSSVL